MVADGDYVRAKRVGWNEELSDEQTWDMVPLGEDDDEEVSVDLEGELEIVEHDTPQLGTLIVYLVGGQEADPDTIEPAKRKDGDKNQDT